MVPSDLRWLRNNPNDIFLRNGIWPAFFFTWINNVFFSGFTGHSLVTSRRNLTGWWKCRGNSPNIRRTFQVSELWWNLPRFAAYALISHWLCNVERFFLWRWLKLSVPSPHQDFLRSSRRKSNQVLVGLMKHVMYNCITSKCCSTNTGDLLITKYLYV